MKPIVLTLTQEEALVLMGVLGKIERNMQRDTRPGDVAEFLRAKSNILPDFDDLTVLAKARGLFSQKTADADVAKSLRKQALKLGLITEPDAS